MEGYCRQTHLPFSGFASSQTVAEPAGRAETTQTEYDAENMATKHSRKKKGENLQLIKHKSNIKPSELYAA